MITHKCIDIEILIELLDRMDKHNESKLIPDKEVRSLLKEIQRECFIAIYSRKEIDKKAA